MTTPTDVTRDPRLTEARNPRTASIDRADTAEIVHLIQAEDAGVAEAVACQAERIAAVVDEVAFRFQAGGRLIYVGAGTSGRLGVLDAAECPPTFGVDPGRVQGVIAGGSPALVRSSEGAEDIPEDGARALTDLDVGPSDFVLGIATSGTTPFVHGALQEAARNGAGTGFLSCTEPPDSMRELVGYLITPLVGPEVIAGSTRMKAGTATKLVLNTITTGAMIRSGRIYQNLMVELRARSAKLVDRGIRIVTHVTGLGRDEARRLLLASGGDVKTSLAMHLLETDRARAERLLDAAGGFLGVAVERFLGTSDGNYGVYPEVPGWPDEPYLTERLEGAGDRLAAARADAVAAEVDGRRVPVRPERWTAAQHVAHLRQLEQEAVEPRVAAWISAGHADAGSASGPTLADWVPGADPTRDLDFERELEAFRRARQRTSSALRRAGSEVWSRVAMLGSERVTLYQFLRGIAQHDVAHEVRVRERVHPSLLAAASVVGEAAESGTGSGG